MSDRFMISWVVENGHPHYKVYDKLTDMEIHCDENELNETIWQLLEMQEVEFMRDITITFTLYDEHEERLKKIV